MRALVIGATGFIGPHVVRLLVEQGHEVAVLHRGETDADLPENVRHIRGNRDRLGDLRREFRRLAPDVVCDAILYTEQQARLMIEVLRGVAGRVVAISSADVYRNFDGFRGRATAPPDPVPLAEDAPLRETRFPYRGHQLAFEHAHDYDKILVEQVLLNQPDLPVAVLRLPAVYGPGDKQRRLAPYVGRMKDGRPAILLAKEQEDWRWTRGFVGNIAAAVAVAITDARSAGRVFNVGEEPAPAEREWVERIGAAVGWEGRIVAAPVAELPNHLRQPFHWRYDLCMDTAYIRKELGFVEPLPSAEALRRAVDWELSQYDGSHRVDYAAEDAFLESRRSDAV